jgi:ATP-dependent helicase HepA
MIWKPGDRLTHRFNHELGPGRVVSVEDRSVVVEFPRSHTELRLAADSDALEPLELPPGSHAKLEGTGETVTVREHLDDDRVRLEDEREISIDLLWPLEIGESLVERLAHGEVDSVEAFSVRLDALHLAAIREADGLGSFLGGRIRLFPHQLHAAEHATRAEPVRWLLADEVGLGKTVEACLILNHLLATGRADRTLVVAPETLTVQWLGELWRKYHQVFVLLDEKRLQDVEKDYGKGFNPFDAHSRVVVSIEMLVENAWLTKAAVEAGIDLLVVDEAHHLRRPPGHPGNAEYRAIRPIADAGRHALLLTATPLEDDAHGFFRLLQLLRPGELPDDVSFEERLERGEPLPPFTSMTRRVDIGGLPPRKPVAIDLERGEAWDTFHRLEVEVRSEPAPHEVARRKKLERIRRALAGGPALAELLGTGEDALRKLARRDERADPRLAWLARQAQVWRERGDKTLVFVAHRSSLEMIRTGMSRLAQVRVGAFHEDLSPAQRDIEVAQFRLPGGPSMLVSTECGGEGRNFEFCTRLVLFDLPWDPMVVEQRIGRLDRIGRQIPVELLYFRPPDGIGAAVVRLFESLGLFEEPLGGLERELAGVESAIERAALEPATRPDDATFTSIVREAREAQTRVQEAAYHELHRTPYRPEMSESILARVPPDLEELTEDVIVAACEQLNLDVESAGGTSRFGVALSNRARVESLPGIAGGSSFLGTFDRQEAVEDETIDFYATGHPLVEGVLAHLEESRGGRVALLRSSGHGEEGFGLLALYKDGPRFTAEAVDLSGNRRPDWAELFTRRPLKTRRVKAESWVRRAGWPTLVRSVASHLDTGGRLVGLAAIQIEP